MEGFIMARWGAMVASAAVIAGAAFVTGASVPPRRDGGFIKLDANKVVVGQKTGYFYMAAVIRGDKKATVGVEQLNACRKQMSANSNGLRAMHGELKKAADEEKDSEKKADLAHQCTHLTRLIEDGEREVNKYLNDQASKIIAGLYDEIHATTIQIAHARGLVVVFAYPDAVTPQEVNDPMVKELKLKPPAAQPFYLDPSVDYTRELLERLNAKFAANDHGQ
jgi:Skp family chaperone for outer membrane proteins